jgi:predicted nucleotidyltransferase
VSVGGWTVLKDDPHHASRGQPIKRCIVPKIAKKTTPAAYIDRIVKRIVKQFRPDRIILFGSHARGDAGPDSDVDLLVVMETSRSVRDKQLEILGVLHDIPIPIDVIVSTPVDFGWRKDVVGTIEWPATREGKVLYARAQSGDSGGPGLDRQSGK